MGATEHEADHADMTDDKEVELNLPREIVEEQIRTSEDIQKLPGAIDPGAMALDQEEQHWFEPLNRARLKGPRHGLPLPSILWPAISVGYAGLLRTMPDYFRTTSNYAGLLPVYSDPLGRTQGFSILARGPAWASGKLSARLPVSPVSVWFTSTVAGLGTLHHNTQSTKRRRRLSPRE